VKRFLRPCLRGRPGSSYGPGNRCAKTPDGLDVLIPTPVPGAPPRLLGAALSKNRSQPVRKAAQWLRQRGAGKKFGLSGGRRLIRHPTLVPPAQCSTTQFVAGREDLACVVPTGGRCRGGGRKTQEHAPGVLGGEHRGDRLAPLRKGSGQTFIRIRDPAPFASGSANSGGGGKQKGKLHAWAIGDESGPVEHQN